LIDAAVSGGYTWLGVVIVVGSMISLGYYLPVLAAMWMGSSRTDTTAGVQPLNTPPLPGAGPLPAIAGGSPELDDIPHGAAPTEATSHSTQSTSHTKTLRPQPEIAFVALLAGAGTLFFGIAPQPLFNLVHGVGSALGLM
jgi:NADH-quinone oxidoreductase subunit N